MKNLITFFLTTLMILGVGEVWGNSFINSIDKKNILRVAKKKTGGGQESEYVNISPLGVIDINTKLFLSNDPELVQELSPFDKVVVLARVQIIDKTSGITVLDQNKDNLLEIGTVTVSNDYCAGCEQFNLYEQIDEHVFDVSNFMTINGITYAQLISGYNFKFIFELALTNSLILPSYQIFDINQFEECSNIFSEECFNEGSEQCEFNLTSYTSSNGIKKSDLSGDMEIFDRTKILNSTSDVKFDYIVFDLNGRIMKSGNYTGFKNQNFDHFKNNIIMLVSEKTVIRKYFKID